MLRFKLDKFYLEKKGLSPDISLDDVLKKPISFISLYEVQTSDGKQLQLDNFPNYLRCLTVTSSGVLLNNIIPGSSIVGKIIVNNPNTNVLYGYQIKVDISALISSHGYNFSLVDGNANTLNYCFEQPNGECNQTPSNTIWIRTNTLKPGNNTIYILNGSRVGLTNGKGVFDFYDDFKNLDTSLWSVYGNALAKIEIYNPTSTTYEKYKFRINISELRKKYGNIKFSIGKYATLPYCYEQPDGSCNQNPTDIIWVWNRTQDTSSAWRYLYIRPGDNWLYIWRSSYGGTTFDIQAYSVPDLTSYVGNLELVDNTPFVKDGELYLANRTGYFNSNIKLKNKILNGGNELIFIKYYLSSSSGENDWWFSYPYDYAGHWFQTFEDESGKWIKTKSWDNNPDWTYWLPSGQALRDDWAGISVARIGKNLYLNYYKPWNNLYKSYILTYTGSADLDSLFTKSGLNIGTCCGNYRTLKFDYIYARKFVLNEPSITLYVY